MWWQAKGDLTSLGISLKIQKGREHDFGKNFYFKPGDRKRLLTVLIVCLIFCNSFLMPVQRVDAVPVALAIPAGIEIGAGAYVVAALGVAAIAGGLGYAEYSDEINAHAQGIWDSAQQTVKDSLLASYSAAVAAGDKTMEISADVSAWLQSKYASIVSAATATAVTTVTTDRLTMTTRYNSSAGSRSYSYQLSTDYAWSTPLGYTHLFILYDYRKSAGDLSFVAPAGYPVRLGESKSRWETAEQPLSKALSVAQAVAGISMVTAAQRDAIQAQDSLKDYFAGPIAVPQPSDFVAYPKSADGTIDKTRGPLVYDPTARTWRDTAKGVDVPVKDIAWAVPVPDVYPVKDATGVATGELGVSVPITTAASTVATPVNVKTGEAVKAETGTANPPLDWSSQPTTSINWAPLKTAAGAFTKKFPFSIPWDVGRQLAIFDVQPKAPVWRMDKTVDMPDFGTGLKNDIHFKWDFDLAVLDPYAVPLRWFVIIAADVGLMLGLRRFLPE